MGFLDNTTQTIDAILTKKGRELLARGNNEFKITKFALGDDEIDYGLYDVYSSSISILYLSRYYFCDSLYFNFFELCN